MNNNKILAIASLLCAIILGLSSSALTAKLFQSFDSTWFGYVQVCIGISLDAGKFVFSAIAGHQFNKERYAGCIVYSLLTVICVLVSFFASLAADLNNVNSIQNSAVISSGAYQKQDEVFKTVSDSVATLKTDIASMKANRAAAEQKIRDDAAPLIATSKKLHLLTGTPDSVAEITKRRDAKIKELDTAIAIKEADLKQKEGELVAANQGFNGVAAQVKTERGIYALATWMNPKNPEEAVGKINLIKNILVEIAAIFFSLGFGILINKKDGAAPYPIDKIDGSQLKKEEAKKTEPLSQTDTQGIIKQPGRTDFPSKRRIRGGAVYARKSEPLSNTDTQEAETVKHRIGFKSPATSSKLDNEIISKYKDYMYKTANKGISKGSKHIAQAIEIDVEMGRKIKAHLEQIGIIETKGTQTFILK